MANPFHLPPQVNTALSLLEAAGFEAFLVGGAVRDQLLGLGAGKDWDIATSARPWEIANVFVSSRVIRTGWKHGTVTVLLDGMPLEITTYRTGGPGPAGFAGSLEEDLAHRDFTINAMAYHPRTGLVDLYGGQEDLVRGMVRCVGNPDQRFQEDGLRLLRGLRFAAVFRMQLAPDTAIAIHRNRALLQAVAPERIRSEWTRLLCGPDAEHVLRIFADVAAVSIPELAPMFGFEQHNPHHDKDIWEHTLAVLSAVPPDPVLRWAALFHDIGKPQCFSCSEDGTGHFYGHGTLSAQLADAILTRLRCDTASRTRIVTLVRRHDTPILPEPKPVCRLLNQLGPEGVRQLIELHKADTIGQSVLCRDRLEQYRQAEAVLDELLREKACFSRRDLAIHGDDLTALGLHGKAVGTALQTCLEAVLDGRVSNERNELLAFLLSDPLHFPPPSI